jgi:tetratricopeptide (TPR) repeat protein
MRLLPRDYLEAGDLDSAIAAYERLDHTAPGYGPTRRLLAETYLERARRVGPTNEEAGRADLARAAELLERAIRQNPYNAPNRLTYARMMMTASRRNLPAATGQARLAVQSEPNNAEAHFLLGALLVEGGQKVEAVAELDKAMGLSGPKDSVFKRAKAMKDRLAAP